VAERILFARSLYAEEAVEAAAAAYRELASFAIVPHAAEIELQVSDIDPEFGARLLDEVSNHVLYETVQRARAATGGT
jgi:hypothetical protein